MQPVLITSGDFPDQAPVITRMVDGAEARRQGRLRIEQNKLVCLSNPDKVYQQFIKLIQLTAEDIAKGALKDTFNTIKPIGYAGRTHCDKSCFW